MSEIAKCPCCGSAMEETYLGYVCFNTSLENPCSFRIAKNRLPSVTAAMELAKKLKELSQCDINTQHAHIEKQVEAAERRVLEVFK